MTLPLNGPSRNDHGALEQRVRQLEQALRQITVRDAGHSEKAPVTRNVNQVAHGFSVDDVVRVSDGGTTWYLARADDSATSAATDRGDHNTGIVTRVLDANNFIATMWGPARLSSVPGFPYMLYCVSEATAGDYEVWSTVTPGINKFRHAVFFHLTNGDVIVLGPEHSHTHSQKMVDLRDVKQGTAPNDGEVPMWVAANSRFEFQIPPINYGHGFSVVTGVDTTGNIFEINHSVAGTLFLIDTYTPRQFISLGYPLAWLGSPGSGKITFPGGPSLYDSATDSYLRINKLFLADDGAFGITARIQVNGLFNCNGNDGFSGNIALAKLTPGGANGSVTVLGGIITGRVNPT